MKLKLENSWDSMKLKSLKLLRSFYPSIELTMRYINVVIIV